MGLPTKYALCGVPGRRGYNTPMSGEEKIHRISYMMYLIYNSHMDKSIFSSDKLKRIMIIYT